MSTINALRPILRTCDTNAVVGQAAAGGAIAAGLDGVMDRCMKIEHERLFGGLNRAGVDTGAITARQPRQLSY